MRFADLRHRSKLLAEFALNQFARVTCSIISATCTGTQG